MSDLLGEALAWFDDLSRVTPWHGSHLTEVLAAARNWHTLTNTEPRQLWSWSKSGKRKVMEPGKFYVVAVDALTDTADSEP